MKNKPELKYCENCGSALIWIEHWEDDGLDGSFEPYWECVNSCPYPEEPDNKLTPEELKLRGKVDTQTEYGIVKVEEV